MTESTKYKTFFDIGFNDNEEKKFATLQCLIYGDKKKKRVVNNELIKKFFDNKPLAKEEIVRVGKILDGSIYSERRNAYDHCKLCSDDFQRKVLEKYSSKYKYWDICIPTFPYFPGGLMIYLKNRKKLKIENLQDLPEDYLKELIQIQEDLYINIRKKIIGDDLVGINVLFNQLSKSELCIHGHVELMIKDIDEKNLGCKYVLERPYDKFTYAINKYIDDDSSIIKIPEGIKILYDKLSISEVKKYVSEYEQILKYYFERGKKLQKKELCIDNKEDEILFYHTVPAATNFVYSTFYRDKHIISSVPELILDFVPFDQVKYDAADLFSLSINRNYTDKDNVFMRNYSPKIRPSIKVYSPEGSKENVLKLQRKIYMGLEK